VVDLHRLLLGNRKARRFIASQAFRLPIPEQLERRVLFASTGLPSGWSGQDIGSVGLTGSDSQSGGVWTVKGAGQNIGGIADSFRFVSESLSGNQQIVAHLKSFSAANDLAKAGLMFRASTSSGAAFGYMNLQYNGDAGFKYRKTTSASAIGSTTDNSYKSLWLKLVRSGSTITGYRSSDGFTWTRQGSASITIGSSVRVGLAVTSYNKAKLATAVFDEVSVTPVITSSPPPPLPPPSPIDSIPPAMKLNDGFIPLFNGQDLSGFSPYINGGTVGSDPKGYFRVENGMLHVLGMGQTGTTMPFGYLATNNSYTNYRLRFQYKWGTTKFAPRNTSSSPRDSGLLTFVTGSDRIWPTCVEVQVQEHDTGDLWLLDPGIATSATTNVASTSTTPPTYKVDGTSKTVNGGRIIHSQSVDSLTDWNMVDVIVEGSSIVVMVNGVVVNCATNIKGPDGNPLTEGRIAFQAEGAEAWYKDIQIKPLSATGTAPDYKVLVLTKPNATADAPAASVATAISQLQFLGQRNGFDLDVAVDDSRFTEAGLAGYSSIIFLGTDGTAQLGTSAEAAFERFIGHGGGFVGIGATPAPPTTSAAASPMDLGPSLSLINSATDSVIQALNDGETLDLNQLGTKLNIAATPNGDPPGSMVFVLDGSVYRIDNDAPYSIGGDTNGDFADWQPPAGQHTLAAQQFSGADGSGAILAETNITFTVIGPTPPPPPPPTFLMNLIGMTADSRFGVAKRSLKTIDRVSSATSSMPANWKLSDGDETYTPVDGTGIHPLLAVTDSAGGGDPISWTRTYAGGRVFYTGLGSSAAAWNDPMLLMHILGGIEYASGTSRQPPSGATVLLGVGTGASAWQKRSDGSAAGWTSDSSAGTLTVAPGTGDIQTKQTFTSDFRLHLEFNVNAKASSVTEQDRGNSGVALFGSYELQILDSFGRSLADENDVGAIYGIKDAAINAALPAGAWETYDVLFTAPVWQGTTKISDAHITAWLNGILVQNNVDVPTSTFTFNAEAPGGGPLILQDHNNSVKFRNIWID
jgi:hypothetical protein